ncbi:glycoside hydrolase family 47 protein [Laccaria bicolor S238N-H82]|uniref:alpha-1,2-Mannosidase n=1 Tax=Laccaria bicolor (strain S238N-H82 / ATCC MYA-4686) TaxID=486041 RepID=B0CU81_LACBS|nr:glycoside hydrolase family 47 protein [Laccaria bicolor S238N-H82]EDR14049.1 glycoside hydrolase family 47 protein [Laccaria bicolor S238N-H82]|eukprot:XP_001874608.1 glycoside hydrolase family 47 protein [Laccaria bicolor S238N-H82]
MLETELPNMFTRKCSRIWHSSRHRPLLLVLLIALYTLYHLVPRNTTDYFSDFLNAEADASPELWNERAEQVKQAFVHAYHGYERYALPNDELKPITRGKIDNFNGWGVTVFDSLDTIYLLGLKDEFERALRVVKQTNFSISVGNDIDGFAPYFETVIRYLGGLLSAYALSKDHMLLERAEDLAIVLDPVFDTPSGMPFYSVNPTTGEHKGPEIGILAEIASLQIEYTYLAKATGKKQYFQRADAVSKTLARANLRDTGGMFPIQWNLTSGQPIGYRLSVGAQADSAHEYLLKQYLLTAKTDKASLEMYLRATTHIITNLMYISPTRHLAYVTDSATSTFWELGEPTHIFEHLSCFLPGMLALGAHTLPLDNLDEVGISFQNLGDQATFGYAAKGFKTLRNYNLTEIHLWAAESLAQTCWLTYADQPSGLGPDEITMKTIHYDSPSESYLWIKAVEKWRTTGRRGPVPGVADRKPVVYTERERLSGKGVGRDYVLRKPGYLLRPETLESLYILWRVTGDSKWRTRSWTIFEAIERETKTPSGYASLRSVEMSPAPKEDSMPSYFLAETLKYLYLMFSVKDPLPLNEWVFNTEAHPFPVFEWSEEEKKAFEM